MVSKGLIGSGVDGTLLDYNYSDGAPTINMRLIQEWRNKAVILITNQGGLALGVQGLKREDGRPYPTPELFLRRLDALVKVLRSNDIAVPLVYVACHHDRASTTDIIKSCTMVMAGLKKLGFNPSYVYANRPYRKPNGAMLAHAGISVYYGDSDEDQQAAKNACVEFVRVSRFW